MVYCPLISVIMLTYNREKLISGMIESILGQTFTEYEFIIVDNGSNDRSGHIAEEYAEKDERIQVIHIEKSSIGKGRNIGLQHATAEYVAFVDDDDTCKNTFLQELYASVENVDEIAICGTNTMPNVQSCTLLPKNAMEILLDRKLFNVGFPTKLIPRAFFEGSLFDEEARFDDIYLMPIMISKAKRIHFVAKSLYVVNRHDSNNSAWTTNYQLLSKEILNEYVDVYEKRTKWLCRIYPEGKLLWRYYKWSFYISMVHKIDVCKIYSCEDIATQMKQELYVNRDEFLRSGKIQEFEKTWMEEYIVSDGRISGTI